MKFDLEEKIKEIEEDEEGEILDVIREYAEMGYTRAFVARMWGFKPSYFRQCLLPRIDPAKTIPWQPQNQCVDYIDALAAGRERSRKLKRYQIGDAWLSAGEIAEAAGIRPELVYRRYMRGLRGKELIRPPMTPREKGLKMVERKRQTKRRFNDPRSAQHG